MTNAHSILCAAGISQACRRFAPVLYRKKKVKDVKFDSKPVLQVKKVFVITRLFCVRCISNMSIVCWMNVYWNCNHPRRPFVGFLLWILAHNVLLSKILKIDKSISLQQWKVKRGIDLGIKHKSIEIFMSFIYWSIQLLKFKIIYVSGSHIFITNLWHNDYKWVLLLQFKLKTSNWKSHIENLCTQM